MGPGFVTVNGSAPDTPSDGSGFRTVTITVPPANSALGGTEPVKSVVLMYCVGTSTPSKNTFAPATNSEPVAVRNSGEPVPPRRASVVFGEIDGVVQAQAVTTKIRQAGAEPAVRALSAAPARAGSENLSLLPVEERF